jgi:ribulose-phosphate 3-epimerase
MNNSSVLKEIIVNADEESLNRAVAEKNIAPENIISVNPGFGGQKFLPEMLPKIRRLRQLCERRGLDPIIEVDGGQTCESAGQAIQAGANAIVAGSALFGSPDYAVAIATIREARRPSARKARA